MPLDTGQPRYNMRQSIWCTDLTPHITMQMQTPVSRKHFSMCRFLAVDTLLQIYYDQYSTKQISNHSLAYHDRYGSLQVEYHQGQDPGLSELLPRKHMLL
jgi:hypothetical protein